MKFTVEESFENRILRDYLQKLGISTALLSKLKHKENGILLNGVCVTVRAVLHSGDRLELAIEDECENEKILPTPLFAELIAETPDYIAVNKPPQMPTHPSHGHFTDTLANALAYRYQNAEPPFRPRFVNRLDRNTSGVVLVARHALASTKLSCAMADGKIHKQYLAVAVGELTKPQILTTGFRRKAESIIFREVCPVGEGDIAVTEITPLCFKNGLTLLALSPKTGRTHQLRVHLAYLGYPLFGDGLYGNEEERFPRHALHAAKLTFPNPADGRDVTLFAALPPDLSDLIEREMGKEALLLAQSFCTSPAALG